MITQPKPKYGWYGQAQSLIRDKNGLTIGSRVQHATGDIGTIVGLAPHSRPEHIVWKVDFDNGNKNYNQAEGTIEPFYD